jgi:hypothetical protein
MQPVLSMSGFLDANRLWLQRSKIEMSEMVRQQFLQIYSQFY